MEPVGPLDYVLDLKNGTNCFGIESATPGEAFTVLVYPEGNPSAQRILARGRLSLNGQWFIVDVTKPDGERDSLELSGAEANNLDLQVSLTKYPAYTSEW